MSKLNISDVLLEIDRRNFDYWNQLGDEQQKELKNSLFILNRYVSNVAPPKPEWKPGFKARIKTPCREEQEYFTLSVNEHYNKDWTTLQRHPELLWKLLCVCGYSPLNKQFFHQWVPFNKRTASNAKAKLLAELFPDKKLDDVELLASIITNSELAQMARDHGLDEATINKQLK